MQTRDIFMEQPILLELEAPLKICGMIEKLKFITINRRHAWSVL